MKNIKLTFIIFFTGMLFIGSCEGVLNDDMVDLGSFMFWSNFDGPPIDIYVEGMNGTITTFYEEAPACEASGCVTFDMEPGSYTFEAIEQSNNNNNPREWSGSITIRANACSKLGLTP
jgi:hypothetical protein